MEYIRKLYQVPAKRGMLVYYRPAKKFGLIIGTHGVRLRIKLHGEKKVGNYHPTWEIDYNPITSF